MSGFCCLGDISTYGKKGSKSSIHKEAHLFCGGKVMITLSSCIPYPSCGCSRWQRRSVALA